MFNVYICFPIVTIAGQFYIVGTPSDMLTAGTQRTIAPRGNVQVNRESLASRTAVAGQGEPVSLRRAFQLSLSLTRLLIPFPFPEG